MSAKIPEELKKRVEKLSHINWSEVMRLAILKRVEEEEKRIMDRNRKIIEQSSQKMDQLRRKAQGNTTEELRAWREIRH
ncbi:MAG: VapB-type antitoxin [Candidatus Heimdallarchaeota archaeon]|nr:MAG: VapB-type antitoxin [Candidatus Heimdallarchaeota archaeon]